MFKCFKRRNQKEDNKSLNQEQRILELCQLNVELNKKITDNKEVCENFILILQQIQEENNKKTAGKGSFFKNYKEKQLHIDNMISLAIENIQQKVKELG